MQPLGEHKIRNGCRNRRENLFNPLKPQFMYCVHIFKYVQTVNHVPIVRPSEYSAIFMAKIIREFLGS